MLHFKNFIKQAVACFFIILLIKNILKMYENLDYNQLLKILTFNNFIKIRKPRQLENFKQLNNLIYTSDRFKIKHIAIFKSENYNKDFFETYNYFNNDRLTVYYNDNDNNYYYSFHSTSSRK